MNGGLKIMAKIIQSISKQIFDKITAGRFYVQHTDRRSFDYVKNGYVIEIRQTCDKRIKYYTHQRALIEGTNTHLDKTLTPEEKYKQLMEELK